MVEKKKKNCNERKRYVTRRYAVVLLEGKRIRKVSSVTINLRRKIDSFP